MFQDFSGHCVASIRNRWECEPEEWGQIMASNTGLEQSGQVFVFMFVIVVGQADHCPVIDASLPEHKSFHGSGGSAIAVAKWMHRTNVVMHGHCLYYAVVPPKLARNRVKESIKGLPAAITTFRSPATWHSEADIVIVSSKCSGLTMVVITSGYYPTVDLQNKLPVDGMFWRKG